MKRKQKEMSLLRILSAAFLLLGLWGATMAQTPPTQTTTPPDQAPAENRQGNQFTDLRPLNLTPDQIQKIRAINFELKDERQAAGMKLRQAQRALAEAVESPTPNESLIEQRSREVAEAQANTIRLRSLAEARILQVLTPEQRVKLREMRQRNLAMRPGRQQQPGAGQRQQGLPRDINNSMLTPAQKRALRRQQKP